MPVLRRCCVMLACAHALAGTTLSPQTGSSAVGASGNPAGAPEQASQSLADMARKLRKDKPAEVRMTEEEGKELFRSVDKVFSFASEGTGFPRRTPVKKQVVGPADIEKFTKQRPARADHSQRFGRAELTMKKFGRLPRDFDLREFLMKASGQSVPGLYDEETKTIWLLNTVAFDRQGPIPAHELTHVF